MKFNQLLAKFDEFPWFATIFVFILVTIVAFICFAEHSFISLILIGSWVALISYQIRNSSDINGLSCCLSWILFFCGIPLIFIFKEEFKHFVMEWLMGLHTINFFSLLCTITLAFSCGDSSKSSLGNQIYTFVTVGVFFSMGRFVGLFFETDVIPLGLFSIQAIITFLSGCILRIVTTGRLIRIPYVYDLYLLKIWRDKKNKDLVPLYVTSIGPSFSLFFWILSIYILIINILIININEDEGIFTLFFFLSMYLFFFLLPSLTEYIFNNGERYDWYADELDLLKPLKPEFLQVDYSSYGEIEVGKEVEIEKIMKERTRFQIVGGIGEVYNDEGEGEYRLYGVIGGTLGSILEINRRLRANFSESERRLVLMGIPVLSFITAGLIYWFYPVSFAMNPESIELIQQFFTN